MMASKIFFNLIDFFLIIAGGSVKGEQTLGEYPEDITESRKRIIKSVSLDVFVSRRFSNSFSRKRIIKSVSLDIFRSRRQW